MMATRANVYLIYSVFSKPIKPMKIFRKTHKIMQELGFFIFIKSPNPNFWTQAHRLGYKMMEASPSEGII